MRKLYTTLSVVLLSFAGFSQASPVACYSFSGNANNGSDTLHHGIVHGAQLTTDRFGNANSAYFFDGIDDFIQIKHHPALSFNRTAEFSLSFWVKADNVQYDSAGYYNTLLSKSANANGNSYPYEFSIANHRHVLNREFKFLREDGGCTHPIDEWSQRRISDNGYSHVALVKRSTVLELYFNGTLVKTYADYLTCSPANTNDIFIGKSGDLNPRFFRGSIDDFIIFDYAISTTQINCLYNNIPSPCFCFANPHVSIEETEKQAFKVYPNPSTTQITVELENLRGKSQLEIYTLSGKLLRQELVHSTVQNFNISELNAGMYLIKIKDGEREVSRRFRKL